MNTFYFMLGKNELKLKAKCSQNKPGYLNLIILAAMLPGSFDLFQISA